MKKRPIRKRVKSATGVARVRHVKAYERYDQIKKYVDFKFTDNEKSARKIREIYNELWPLLHQPHTDYELRSGGTRGVATKSVGIKNRKSYRYVPVPSNGVENVRVTVRGKKLQVKSGFVEQTFLHFDKRALARRKGAYINSLVAPFKRGALFKIQTGNYEINAAHSKETIAAEVEKLQLKYKIGNTVEGRGKIKRGQNWQFWLNGLVKFEAKNQIDARAYIARNAKLKKLSYKANKKKRIK